MGTIRVTISISNKTQADAESLKATLQGLPALAGAEVVSVEYHHSV